MLPLRFIALQQCGPEFRTDVVQYCKQISVYVFSLFSGKATFGTRMKVDSGFILCARCPW